MSSTQDSNDSSEETEEGYDDGRISSLSAEVPYRLLSESREDFSAEKRYFVSRRIRFVPPDAHAKRSLRMGCEKRLQLVCRPEFQGVILICVDRNRMKIRKGPAPLKLSPNEEARIYKEEMHRRKKLRLQQVREQSNAQAAKIRHAVKEEKHRLLMKVATDIKDQLEAEKAERVRHLEQQYDNSLRNIGQAHKSARQQPDVSAERELVRQAENSRAEARGQAAVERQRELNEQQNYEANKHIMARQHALLVEKQRASEIAAKPPPPPDPLQQINAPKQKPVKVTDMNTFSTSHYHLQNEHAVDRAGSEEQENANEAAEVEAERISARALELRQLRQDQLERARLRHNAALEKELLKHDYNNILHDLSDLQRADRERRLKIVHNIPKQVFEPPNARMEDREDKQRNLEEEFENMYMAGTDRCGDISLALDPTAPETLMSTSLDPSLDVTGGAYDSVVTEGSPLQEPTLPGMPNVLRDMTNGQKPAKKPEKVLRSLMDRIKCQREEWVNTHSMLEVGQGAPAQGAPAQPHPQHTLTQGVEMTMMNGGHSVPMSMTATSASLTNGHDSQVSVPATTYASNLGTTSNRQQTNVQVPPQPGQVTAMPPELQQAQIAQVLREQEQILEQKRQLELKLQQLTYEQHKIQLANKASAASSLPSSQPLPSQPSSVAQSVSSMYHQHAPHYVQQQTNVSLPPQSMQAPHMNGEAYYQGQGQVNAQTSFQGHPVSIATSMYHQQQQQQQQQPIQQQQQNLASSLSSSGMSQKPMNSIPPTHTTGTAPIMTSQGQGQGYYGNQGQFQPPRSAFQPASDALTTDQLYVPSSYAQVPASSMQTTFQNGFPEVSVTMATQLQPSVPVSSTVQGQVTASPGHLPPASLTNDRLTEQMRKVREYQAQVLASHEQGKKALEETKNEIKRRRENLLQRYPNLDLSRLENLGAKYLETQQGAGLSQQIPAQQGQPSQASQPVPVARGQVQSSVASLLATLAAHPYYAATLSQPDGSSAIQSVAQPTTTATVGAVQAPHPNINLETNLRKNKLEAIRKSLPFDGDDSFQTPVRVYEAYAQRSLDDTSATDITESETSTLTERGSPALKPAPRPAPRNLDHHSQRQPVHAAGHLMNDQSLTTGDEETEVDTSCLTDQDDPSSLRQDDLKKQLAQIQQQKEEIIRRHQQGQQKMANREEELRAKLASLAPDDVARQLRDSARQTQQASAHREALQQVHKPFNLSTILEVETPSTVRPSDSARSSSGHSDPETSQHSLPTKPGQGEAPARKREVIPEQPDLENVETQMEVTRSRPKGHPVADYSGKNIDDVLERAKRFESEVLEKLRKQTNAVLFDNEFDDSLEFNVSRRQTSLEPLSTGSLTDDSLSTGPLDDTTLSHQDKQKSGNGSFQSTSRTWAEELSQYKMPASNQSDLAFKVVPPPDTPDGQQFAFGKAEESRGRQQETLFTGNRFKVYSDINRSVNDSTQSSGMLENSLPTDSTNNEEMMKHLHQLQEQLRKVEEDKIKLSQKLAAQSSKTSEGNFRELSNVSKPTGQEVLRPYIPAPDKSDDLSQYSFTDTSADVSAARPNDQSDQWTTKSHESPSQSGRSMQESERPPVRRSPIGHSAKRAEFQRSAANGRASQDVTTSDYSFSMNNSKDKISTSTPEARKLTLEGSRRSEMPSEITTTNTTVSDTKGSTLSEYSMLTEDSTNRNSFNTMPSKRENRKADSPTEDLSQLSLTSAEDDIQEIKREFQKFDKPEFKVKTYAVNIDGDLISEHSGSDQSDKVHPEHKNNDTLATDLTNYSLSTRDSKQFSTMKTDDSSALSMKTLPDSSADTRLSQMSEFSNKSYEGRSVSIDSNPKSSSLTNVTSDPSLNATGFSNLSQYTLNDTNRDSLSTKGTLRESLKDTESDVVQERFASLDNLISESKHLIAKHKQVIEKSKTLESEPPALPKQPPPPLVKSLEREETSGRPSSSDLQRFKSTLSSFESGADDSSRLTSMDMSSKTGSLSAARDSTATSDTTGNQSSNLDENSLEYMVEHSAGITDEEPLPDLTAVGSELSLLEGLNKTDNLSESSDSLKSFENHEMSETENTHTNADYKKKEAACTEKIQRIIEARKHNFMIECKQRAIAATERSRAQATTGKTDQQHPVFRAVPVNIVAEPTLSMAVSSNKAERGRSPTPAERGRSPTPTDRGRSPAPADRGRSPVTTSVTVPVKGANSVSDAKKSFEAKEQEIKSSITPTKPLNRALQPRGWESPKDGGTIPSEAVSRYRDPSPSSSRFGKTNFSSNSSTPDSKEHHGRLFGEIQQFGGSAGLAQRQPPSPPTPKKTPPKVMPKPVRHKSEEITSASAKPASSLSKTLASWKKSRAVSVPQPVSRAAYDSAREPSWEPTREPIQNSIKVLPQEAPAPMSEEERQRRAEEEQYERKIRAYNPRLFRLQHRLDSTDELDSSGSAASPPEKPRDSRKEFAGNLRVNRK